MEWTPDGGSGLHLDASGPAPLIASVRPSSAVTRDQMPMNPDQITVILKRFETPDETRLLQKGRFEVVRIGGMTIGRATYEPGWRWSEHVGPGVGATHCSVEHVGMVLSGTATAVFDDGRVFELRAGDLFYIPPVPHDSWVIGDEPYVSLHFLGADHYAKPGA
jgi:quercetin dioxygenase-like cupin family protein